MIRQEKDMQQETREKMRGGNGSVKLQHVFKDEEMTAKTRLCAKITLEKGCSIGVHQHATDEEIYYILQGTGKVVEDSGAYTVKKGDAVLTGNGASHSIENIGEDTLELLAVVVNY
ncbi:MAG: mannose-6-phosphate isomerase [Clostridia bacterium]|nr:mannose-6-phosphate isomerase [Clostridia bacterium]